MNILKLSSYISALALIVGTAFGTISYFATAEDLKNHEEFAVETMQQHQMQQASMQIDEIEEQLKYDELSPERRLSKERQLKYWKRQEEKLLRQLSGGNE